MPEASTAPEKTSSYLMAAGGFVYAFGVFVVPLARRTDWQLWAITAASLVGFAWLYWDYLRHVKSRPRRAHLNLALMIVLGAVLALVNVAAVMYVIYASALSPLTLSPRRAVTLAVFLAAAMITEIALLETSDRLTIGSWVGFLIVATSAAHGSLRERERQHTLLQRAREEIEGLATIAERERIARDLHDVLGHTLSVIALKSELASQLAETDAARAVSEIREVEIVSREALTEVRATVEGYRSSGLAGELQRATRALDASGVAVDFEIESVQVVPKLETVLALVVREAVTNIIRHAKASVCRVRLKSAGETLVLTVEDDGIGGVRPTGNGLMGMLERVTSVGGRLDIDTVKGVALRATFPWKREAAS